MIESKQVATVFNRNLGVAKRQLEGLSHEDCLLQLPFRGNCINWILGHLLSSRQSVLKLLELGLVIEKEALAPYEYDSEALNAATEGVINLDRLVNLLDVSQELISDALNNLDDDLWLNKEINDKGNKLWERIEFLSWHETYHVGQLEYLRQLAGTDDKVI